MRIGESDEELVARAVATADTRAFEALVARHQSRVRNWLRRLAGDASSADDLAQETFVHAWRVLASFEGRGRFVAWLMKIAYTTYLGAARKRSRERRLVMPLGDEHLEAAATPAPHAELADLETFLSALTPEERNVLVLCYAHEMSHAEIAAITGLPLGTVKSHARRGKLKIRERFDLPNAGGGTDG